MATARQGEVSIHIENPGPLAVLQVLSMTVEELRYELQARNLTTLETAKPDLQQTLLSAVAPLPPDQHSPVVSAPGDARPRTFSGQTNSTDELQLQLRRLELEAEEKNHKRQLENELEGEKHKRAHELAAEEKKRAHELEMKRLELAAHRYSFG